MLVEIGGCIVFLFGKNFFEFLRRAGGVVLGGETRLTTLHLRVSRLMTRLTLTSRSDGLTLDTEFFPFRLLMGVFHKVPKKSLNLDTMRKTLPMKLRPAANKLLKS